MKRAVGLVIGGALILTGAALAAGQFRWRAETRTLRARLDEARREPVPARVDFRELDGLPPPVVRYLRTVLGDGQPAIAAARFRQTGTFDMGEGVERWRPFSADQYVTTARPGFDWHARIQMAPLFGVRVHDAYVAGQGVLHASLGGLIAMANVRDTGEVARGELLRFLAEAAWYPTALLPGRSVAWSGMDERQARVTLTDGGLTVAMTVHFDDDGLIARVEAERSRMAGDVMVPTRWQGRFWNYQPRAGMLVPLDGEVAWELAGRLRPYWRGHIESIDYEWATD